MRRSRNEDDDEVTGPQGRRRDPPSTPPWAPAPSFPPAAEPPPEKPKRRAKRDDVLDELTGSVEEMAIAIYGDDETRRVGLIDEVRGAAKDAFDANSNAERAIAAARGAANKSAETNQLVRDEILPAVKVLMDRTAPKDGALAKLATPTTMKVIGRVLIALVPVLMGIIGLGGIVLGYYYGQTPKSGGSDVHDAAPRE